MNMQTPLAFLSIVLLGFWYCAGLCLRAAVVAWGKLWVFLAASPCSTRASSSGFCSPWPVRSRWFGCVGPNPALKPTRRLWEAHPVREATQFLYMNSLITVFVEVAPITLGSIVALLGSAVPFAQMPQREMASTTS